MTAFFRDVIGQDASKHRLQTMFASGRMPHALLISGPRGNGKMALALGLARLLCCSSPKGGEGCGVCKSCKSMDRLMHPDVNYAFPIVKLKSGKDTLCDDYISQWRQYLTETRGYVDLSSWLDKLNSQNKQAQIYTRETDEIQSKLAYKPMMSDRKVMLIWLPEKMNAEASNKLLKLLEEPPEGTVFLLLSEEPDLLLPTIKSRTQELFVPPLSMGDIVNTLSSDYGVSLADSRQIASIVHGDLIAAFDELRASDDKSLYFELFKSMMRNAYSKRMKLIKDWSEVIASLVREKQKSFLEYSQQKIRESFVTNFHDPELVSVNLEEENFMKKFAPFVNTNNVEAISEELERAQVQIEQNANSKIVFFDLALSLCGLI